MESLIFVGKSGKKYRGEYRDAFKCSKCGFYLYNWGSGLECDNCDNKIDNKAYALGRAKLTFSIEGFIISNRISDDTNSRILRIGFQMFESDNDNRLVSRKSMREFYEYFNEPVKKSRR